jgi:hypothetical protein
MEHMETLVKIKFSGRYGQIYTETDPIKRRIMDVIHIVTLYREKRHNIAQTLSCLLG